jgi:hypothetical protein
MNLTDVREQTNYCTHIPSEAFDDTVRRIIRGNLPDALLLLLAQSNFAAKARSIKQWILIIYLLLHFHYTQLRSAARLFNEINSPSDIHHQVFKQTRAPFVRLVRCRAKISIGLDTRKATRRSTETAAMCRYEDRLQSPSPYAS